MDWLKARNILAVRLDNMGDVVMLGPALRAVNAASSEVKITLLGSPAGVQAAALLPWIDDTIEWRPIWQDVGSRMPLDPHRELELVALLKDRDFDGALIFTSFSQSPHAPAYVCYLAGIPLRAGESTEFGGSVLTDALSGAPVSMHQVDRNLRLVNALGFRERDSRMQLDLTEADRQAASDVFAMAGIIPESPVVLVHPGASAAARRYPADKYAEATRQFIDSGWQVVVTGTEREAGIVESVVCEAPGAVMLVGGTTLGQYAAMIERVSAVVCGNTLPLHLADAVGTPVVALYSGTDLESQWRPRFSPHVLLRQETLCHPCYRFECPIGQPCLDILPGRIVAAVQRLCPDRAARCGERWAAAGD